MSTAPDSLPDYVSTTQLAWDLWEAIGKHVKRNDLDVGVCDIADAIPEFIAAIRRGETRHAEDTMDPTVEQTRLTSDVVLVHYEPHTGERSVLLIKRRWDPYGGRWALPGGHVDAEEPTEKAAARELKEETGLTAELLHLVGVYADPGRDPRGRYVTFAYRGFVYGSMPVPVAADDAIDARWWPVAELTDQMMAFDHLSIIGDAIKDMQ